MRETSTNSEEVFPPLKMPANSHQASNALLTRIMASAVIGLTVIAAPAWVVLWLIAR